MFKQKVTIFCGPTYKAAMEGKPVPAISGIYLQLRGGNPEQQRSKGVKTPLIEMSKKNTKQSHAILEPTQKVSASYDQCALRYDTSKLGVLIGG